MSSQQETGHDGSAFVLRIANLHPALLLCSFLGIFALLSIIAMQRESSTFDEGAHLTAAYVSLVRGDYRLDPSGPPIGRRIAAFPLLFRAINLPANSPSWAEAWFEGYAFEFLYQCGNNSDELLFIARLASMFWGLLLIGSVYAVARDELGPLAALIALTLSTFSPTLIAHAHLVTIDTCVASLMFLSVIGFRKWLNEPTLIHGLACGILLGGALMSKFSSFVLIPIFICMLVDHYFSSGTRDTNFSTLLMFRFIGIRRSAGIVLIAGLVYIVAWGSYGFRFEGSQDPSFRIASDDIQRVLEVPALAFIEKHRLLPEALLWGLSEFKEHVVRGHPAFALGQYSQQGWWWYFPFVLFVKSPIATLVLIGWGAYAWTRLHSSVTMRNRFIPISGALIIGLAMMSTVNIGVRHLLPAFPFLFLLGSLPGSFALQSRLPAISQKVLAALLCAAASEAISACPSYISYINFPTAVRYRRENLLACSNVDWGQDLRRLKDYMDQNGISKVLLSYYGTASPRQINLNHEVLPGTHLYSYFEKEWHEAKPFEKGDVVAVSETNLVGVYLPNRSTLRQLLGKRKPFTSIGHSILLFRIEDP